MKNPIFAASYESGVELMAAGCPLDYLDDLPRQLFRVEQLPGYGDSRVYELGPFDTGWVIPVRLRTNRSSGTVISDLDFETPWQKHAVNWDYEPQDIIPKRDQEDYKRFFKSRLSGVLNEGRLIKRGYPVEGVLCGRSFQPIGESFHGFISAKLTFIDDLGNTVPLCIALNLYRHSSIASRIPGGEVRHSLFRHVDPESRLDPGAVPAGPGSESSPRGGPPGILDTGFWLRKAART